MAFEKRPFVLHEFVARHFFGLAMTKALTRERQFGAAVVELKTVASHF